jgi:glycosyltransferase involved in cell wall biosynthesis
MDVSVVLSTYNRASLLRGALECLRNQQTSDTTYELIVVDNNSTDETRAVIEQVAKGTSGIRYVHEPRQGLAFGLNTGIGYASGSIIALTDDDIRVTPHYIQAIKQVFQDYPDAAFLGGKVLPRWPIPPPAWLTSDHWSPLALQDYRESVFFTSLDNPVPLVNKAFRRSIFSEVGLFNTSLGKVGTVVGDVADHELMARIWRAGRLGMYAPSVVVHAVVQEERMVKKYHRSWHAKHGKMSAKMAMAHKSSPLFSNTLFGAPISPYRRLLTALYHYPGAILHRDDSRSFYYENRMRYSIGYLLEFYRGGATESR